MIIAPLNAGRRWGRSMTIAHLPTPTARRGTQSRARSTQRLGCTPLRLRRHPSGQNEHNLVLNPWGDAQMRYTLRLVAHLLAPVRGFGKNVTPSPNCKGTYGR